ncbi:hypothetical protein ONS95_007919 [Cadophora gregata]|uniref:uncharacterized protein n=1 Tax=Cadophora gregata TaxID=51156 RepID=UPI0026DC8BFB|nr:uncharacterized protein ONS95_007919 [Cadophora gregata]KAK0126309.1 hypothetical protein ONS95_007919 [Cadophora gregata]
MMDQIMYFHSNPVPQRSHKKSTSGCRACKIRKVKCDEQKPVCKRCQVHFKNITRCDYETSRNKMREPRVTAQFIPHTMVEVPLSKNTPQLASSKSPKEFALFDRNIQAERTLTCSRYSASQTKCCKCPCHYPEFTNMLLDLVFGICRICGNYPNLSPNSSDCNPVISDAILMPGRIDPFQMLPAKSSPRVYALMHHWNTSLALFPTQIHSQYCTNPLWLSAAISNPTLFNTTLYVAAVHDAGLHGFKDTVESLFYKAQTIRVLNEALRNPSQAVTDETLSAVLLLTHIVCIIGEPEEVETHLSGLRQMIDLRRGSQTFSVAGVFLHMLCTTNHLTAVISESKALHPPTSPYTPSSINPSSSAPFDESSMLKAFAITSGFHSTVADILYEMGCLHNVLDAFSSKLLPHIRQSFENLMETIERMGQFNLRENEVLGPLLVIVDL